MAPAAPLSDTAKAVLDYHRTVPDNEPRFASCLIEQSCIKSLAELDAAYDELWEAEYIEAVGLGLAIDQKTGKTLVRTFSEGAQRATIRRFPRWKVVYQLTRCP